MRSYSLAAILLVAASIAVHPASAQAEGDPVTYTDGTNVYTAVLDGDLDTVSPVRVIQTALDTLTTAIAQTTIVVPVVATTTARAAVSEDVGLVWQPSPTVLAEPSDVVEDEPSRLLFIQQRLQRRHLAPAPTSFPLLKRQNQGGAALGGGGGAITTQTGLQIISGYTPPQATIAPSPTNQISGTILQASQIPGYTGAQNEAGVSSGSSKVVAAQLAIGLVGGAVVFALL